MTDLYNIFVVLYAEQTGRLAGLPRDVMRYCILPYFITNCHYITVSNLKRNYIDIYGDVMYAMLAHDKYSTAYALNMQSHEIVGVKQLIRENDVDSSMNTFVPMYGKFVNHPNKKHSIIHSNTLTSVVGDYIYSSTIDYVNTQYCAVSVDIYCVSMQEVIENMRVLTQMALLVGKDKDKIHVIGIYHLNNEAIIVLSHKLFNSDTIIVHMRLCGIIIKAYILRECYYLVSARDMIVSQQGDIALCYHKKDYSVATPLVLLQLTDDKRDVIVPENWSCTATQVDAQEEMIPIGAQGISGENSSIGAIGLQGPIGASGPTGFQGPIGAMGQTGPQGECDIQGPDHIMRALSPIKSNHIAVITRDNTIVTLQEYNFEGGDMSFALIFDELGRLYVIAKTRTHLSMYPLNTLAEPRYNICPPGYQPYLKADPNSVPLKNVDISKIEWVIADYNLSDVSSTRESDSEDSLALSDDE